MSFLTSWHARLMVVAWVILIPLGVMSARFLKVLPKQNWPQELDNPTWWYGHLILQWSGAVLTAVAISLIVRELGEIELLTSPHHAFGWVTVLLLLFQVLSGLFRGSKGGPTYPARDGSWRGDHYDMSRHRLIFEFLHKSLGYLALFTASLAVLFGLWNSNAFAWMWLIIVLWWLCFGMVWVMFERRIDRVTTYQAIWGPDRSLPGNKK